MFLSKISVVPSAHSAEELFKLGKNGTYASHQLLWRLFTEQQARNFLYREEMSSNGLPSYLVLSQTPPANDSPLFAIQSKAFTPRLSKGVRLGFSLRVNPTISVKDEQGKSKRHDVMMHAKYLAAKEGISDSKHIQQRMDEAALRWISDADRLERWGFRLEAMPSIESYTQHKTNGKQRIQFSSVDYQGVLTVDDPDKFLEQYAKGYGKAKSMGCGLMLIRPV